MVRAPYPARIAAGLVVTAIEETRKLPALVVTLPMTAVSQTVQAGMRMQQSIAELAIKGDLALETLFDRPVDQPEWARFDEDDAAIDAEADRTPIESSQGERSDATTTETVSPETEGPEAPKAPAKSAPAKKTATTKAPAKKAASAKKAAAPKAAAPKADAVEPPDAAPGRFALYSTPPDDLVNSDGAAGGDGDDPAGGQSPTGTGDPVPEIVEYIEYDNLTLAQLRAKLRGVGVAELEQLAAYERANKSRAPFVTMIDNRIASQTSKRQPTT
ncbi:lipid droplet-associated protein [Gordonia sp. PKS22-38]|uniref:Lipid droplet-associated protein n=1 Tax=Gordonia prachuapensis TaxID=3115651 RepID=A0ABU7MPU9_9ACTN|nr:lipid droplet-associated protein [Gordonia sp. PKS22-38]